MKKPFSKLIIVAVIIIGFFVAGPFYIINEGEQAVIVQMGRIVRVVTNAGLYLKVPFIDEVVRYPKRIMAWDGEARSMPTRERQFIFVDVVARWRIADPKVFYESIGTVNAAYLKLAEIIDSEVRTVVAANYLREMVRNSDHIILRQLEAEIINIEGIEDDIDAELIFSAMQTDTPEPILRGRRQLSEEVLDRARRMVPEYGIELIDVVTRQVRYTDELTQSVHARMIRERNQIAQFYRSTGEGRKASWLGRMDNDRLTILSDAYRQSQTIRGRADAEAATIYANAYNQDAQSRAFFTFWRGIESYRSTLPAINKVITTDAEYFRHLYTPR